MSDRASSGAIRHETRKSPRARCRPALESLEQRQLLAASLGSLPDITVPDYLGYQVPLDGSGSNASTQNYSVTSSNPDIAATVAQGQFLTMNVSHQSSGAGDPAFSGNITLQLFNDLTPTTATKIEGFVNSGFYNNKNIFRVANGFPDQSGYIVQGGSPNNLSTGVSGLPGTPFGNELVQQVAFAGPGQLAMANTGQPNSNDTQFFITNATQPSNSNLMYNYTIFGQVVSGMNLVNQMTQVALTTDPVSNAKSFPVSPIVVNSETLSSTNPNGVVHVDATQAQAGETSTITVTATDPATNTSTQRSFQVSVASNTNSYSGLTLRPVAFAATQQYTVNTPKTIQLAGSAANSGQPLTYAITTQPTHGTLSGLNMSTGTVVYTPNANYQGNDSFQFTVTNSTAKLTSNPRTVTLTTTPAQAPTASPVTASTQFGNPTTIQLSGSPPASGQSINYSITTQPTKGTLSQLNAATGTVVYTPTPGATGSDTFQYAVTNVGPPAPGLVSAPATVIVNLVQNPINTHAVRQIGNVLIVTPPPGDFTSKAQNTIVIKQTTTNPDPTMNNIQVFINGQLDINQPQDSSVSQIVVYGGKASNTITVDPTVDSLISVTLIGGHGKKHVNVIQAGAGPTLVQSWFGKHSTLSGGTGTNELIGVEGRVKFRPTTATDLIFAGVPRGFQRVGRHYPPGGTFFKLNKHGKLVPIPTPPITPNYQDFTPPKTTTHPAKPSSGKNKK
jgi:cyclophilin family peptidyl-prolyl cis-trans isomerase